MMLPPCQEVLGGEAEICDSGLSTQWPTYPQNNFTRVEFSPADAKDAGEGFQLPTNRDRECGRLMRVKLRGGLAYSMVPPDGRTKSSKSC